MWRIALPLLATGCAAGYHGEHTAHVTTMLVLGDSSTTVEATEQIEIVEGSLENNELWLHRGDCELQLFKRGGFGLRFVEGQECARDGGTWTLRDGGAPNERTDTLTIDLVWDVAIGERSGTADETLRIEL